MACFRRQCRIDGYAIQRNALRRREMLSVIDYQ
jgi:hypothetical protein